MLFHRLSGGKRTWQPVHLNPVFNGLENIFDVANIVIRQADGAGYGLPVLPSMVKGSGSTTTPMFRPTACLQASLELTGMV